jgi:hypothetical protein
MAMPVNCAGCGIMTTCLSVAQYKNSNNRTAYICRDCYEVGQRCWVVANGDLVVQKKKPNHSRMAVLYWDEGDYVTGGGLDITYPSQDQPEQGFEMKINGYLIREAIKRWTLYRDTVQAQFKESLYYFDEDQKSDPIAVMNEFNKADSSIAYLEEAQQRFNQIVQVTVLNETMPLTRAVKLVGNAGRREKMWRDASIKKKDRYSYDDKMSRSKDTEYAKSAISRADAIEESAKSSKFAAALRNAIARGNNTDVNLESLLLSESDYTRLFE